MAKQSKITIRVTHNRSGTSVAYSTKGQYFSTPVNGFMRTLSGLPIYSNDDASQLWVSVLAAVSADLTAHPTPP